MAKEISNDSLPITAQDVANAFVTQYYLILHLTPKDAHKFYKDGSVMARSGSDSTMTVVSTMKEINDAIMSVDYKECTSKIDIVHAQSSLNESVLVGVTGHLTGKDNVTRTFTQTFMLAPQSTGGYYVMNDILFYVDVKETVRSPALSVDDVPENAATTPLAQDPEPTHVPESKKVIEEIPEISDQSDKKNVAAKSETTAKISSSKNNVASVPKPVSISQPDPAKTSYASMLAKEREATTPAPLVVRVKPGQQSSTGVPSVAKPASPPKASVPASNGAKGMVNSPTDVKSIHIRGLPFEITDEELIQTFKKFGVVHERSIRIKRFDDGFCYAFLEFETAKSAHAAVESEIAVFRGKKAQIQYKTSTKQNKQGYNRGRSPSARGGYYNGNYKNQARGSSAGRNGDSYQRQGYQNGGEKGFHRGGRK